MVFQMVLYQTLVQEQLQSKSIFSLVKCKQERETISKIGLPPEGYLLSGVMSSFYFKMIFGRGFLLEAWTSLMMCVFAPKTRRLTQDTLLCQQSTRSSVVLFPLLVHDMHACFIKVKSIVDNNVFSFFKLMQWACQSYWEMTNSMRKAYDKVERMLTSM